MPTPFPRVLAHGVLHALQEASGQPPPQPAVSRVPLAEADIKHLPTRCFQAIDRLADSSRKLFADLEDALRTVGHASKRLQGPDGEQAKSILQELTHLHDELDTWQEACEDAADHASDWKDGMTADTEGALPPVLTHQAPEGEHPEPDADDFGGPDDGDEDNEPRHKQRRPPYAGDDEDTDLE